MNILIVAVALFAVPALGARFRPVPEILTESYIINGVDVNIADVPHQGSLRFFGSHSCGCALLGGKWAITAAHCVGSPAFFYDVAFGTDSRTSGDTYAIEEIFVHPDFEQDGFLGFPNDVALLKLGTEVDESSNRVQRIKMATPQDGDFTGSKCNITGWGLTREGGAGSLPSRLQGANVTVMSQDECSQTFDNVNEENHVCVTGRGVGGACNGDSGGPLTCDLEGEKVLVGVTSWGINGCYTDFPSVYTRLSTYDNWVNDIIGQQ